MALSIEENELITHVGLGTPCGEMMRRYWWPIALAENVKEAGAATPENNDVTRPEKDTE